MAFQLRTVAGIVIAGVAIGFAGLSAEAAVADTAEDAFLAQIKTQGISYDSRRQARDDAEVVCARLANGVSVRDVAVGIVAASDLSDAQAAYLVAASVTFYCGDSSSRIL